MRRAIFMSAALSVAAISGLVALVFAAFVVLDAADAMGVMGYPVGMSMGSWIAAALAYALGSLSLWSLDRAWPDR